MGKSSGTFNKEIQQNERDTRQIANCGYTEHHKPMTNSSQMKVRNGNIIYVQYHMPVVTLRPLKNFFLMYCTISVAVIHNK